MPVINTNVIDSAGQERDRRARSGQQVNQALQGLTNTFMDVAKFGEQQRQFNKLQEVASIEKAIEAQGGNYKEIAQKNPALLKRLFTGIMPEDQVDNVVTGLAEGSETNDQAVRRAVKGYLAEGGIEEYQRQLEQEQQQQGQPVSFREVPQEGTVERKEVLNLGTVNPEVVRRREVPTGQGPYEVTGQDTAESPFPGKFFESGEQTTKYATPGGRGRDLKIPPGTSLEGVPEKRSVQNVPVTKTLSAEESIQRTYSTIANKAQEMMEQNPGIKDYEAVNKAFGFEDAGIAPEHIPSEADLVRNFKPGDTSYKEVYVREHGEEAWNKIENFAREKGFGAGEEGVKNLYMSRQMMFTDSGDIGDFNAKKEFSVAKVFEKEAQPLFDPDLSPEQKSALAKKTFEGVEGQVVAKVIEDQNLTAKEKKVFEKIATRVDPTGKEEQTKRRLYKAVKPGYEPYARLLNKMSERGIDVPGLATGLLQEQTNVDVALAQVDQEERRLELLQQEIQNKLKSNQAQEQIMGQMLGVQVMESYLENVPKQQAEALKQSATIVNSIVDHTLKAAGGNEKQAKNLLGALLEEDSPYGNFLRSYNKFLSSMTGTQEFFDNIQISTGPLGLVKAAVKVPGLEGTTANTQLNTLAEMLIGSTMSGEGMKAGPQGGQETTAEGREEEDFDVKGVTNFLQELRQEWSKIMNSRVGQ